MRGRTEQRQSVTKEIFSKHAWISLVCSFFHRGEDADSPRERYLAAHIPTHISKDHRCRTWHLKKELQVWQDTIKMFSRLLVPFALDKKRRNRKLKPRLCETRTNEQSLCEVQGKDRLWLATYLIKLDVRAKSKHGRSTWMLTSCSIWAIDPGSPCLTCRTSKSWPVTSLQTTPTKLTKRSTRPHRRSFQNFLWLSSYKYKKQRSRRPREERQKPFSARQASRRRWYHAACVTD